MLMISSSRKRVTLEAAIVRFLFDGPFDRSHTLGPSSFWTAASLADILRRFKNTGKHIKEFPDCTSRVPLINSVLTYLLDVAIQLNDVSLFFLYITFWHR